MTLSLWLPVTFVLGLVLIGACLLFLRACEII
jgi:hypothetical protein